MGAAYARSSPRPPLTKVECRVDPAHAAGLLSLRARLRQRAPLILYPYRKEIPP